MSYEILSASIWMYLLPIKGGNSLAQDLLSMTC